MIEEPTRRAKISSAILGTIGALLIAIPSLVTGHALWAVIGAPLGVGLAVMIMRLGYVNRRNTARTRSGIPAWGAGIGFLGAAIGIIAGEVGAGGYIPAFIGGFLLAIAAAQVVLPLVLPAGEHGVSR